jgi:molybdate transport system substrate-binding protein
LVLKYKDIKFYNLSYDKTTFLGTDSKSLNKFLKEKTIDMTINWRASAFFQNNKEYIDIVNIDEKYAPKKKLMLTLLSFSKQPQLAREFMEFATSDEGKDIMKSYGFL